MDSELYQKTKVVISPRVLILVLMEDGLGEPGKNTHPVTIDQVLILVLMEDGLGVYHTLVRTSSMGES